MKRWRLCKLLIPCTLALAWMTCPAWPEDDDEERMTATPRFTREINAVQLTPGQVMAAGLVSRPLDATVLEAEVTSFGKVLDIQPLLDLRSRLRAAVADGEVAEAALRLAEKNRNRIQALYQADIIAGRELSQVEAQWQSDRTRAEAARRHADEIRREALNLWGQPLAQLALEGNAGLLDNLATHRRVLLQITLPASLNPAAKGAVIHIGRDFDREKAVRAEWVSAAPRTDELVQGETWFFHAPAEHLRAGMRVNAWASAGVRRQGAALPLAAVIWHAGRPWVYREDGDGHYTRLPIDPDALATRFIGAGLPPGTRVVVAGAQTLLSEEFKGQIPDEDESTENR
jgi:hypothetical protein